MSGARIQVTAAIAQMHAFARDLSDQSRGIVSETVDAARVHAQQNPHLFKSHTGQLTSSFRTSISDRGYRIIGRLYADESRAPYAKFVRWGTRPHEIRPKFADIGPLRPSQSRRAKTDVGTHRVALRWYQNGALHFASVVHHPGTSPRPFFDEAARWGERQLGYSLEALVDRLARR